MKLNGGTYIELGLVISIIGGISFIANDHARINSAQADIIRMKDRIGLQNDTLANIRENVAEIKGIVQSIKVRQEKSE